MQCANNIIKYLITKKKTKKKLNVNTNKKF